MTAFEVIDNPHNSFPIFPALLVYRDKSGRGGAGAGLTGSGLYVGSPPG